MKRELLILCMTLAVIVATTAAAVSVVAEDEAVVVPRLIDQYEKRYDDGHYEYRYALSNGDTRYEHAYWQPTSKNPVLARKGYYSYPLPDNKFLTVFYTSDQNGFQQELSSYSQGQPTLPRTMDVPQNQQHHQHLQQQHQHLEQQHQHQHLQQQHQHLSQQHQHQHLQQQHQQHVHVKPTPPAEVVPAKPIVPTYVITSKPQVVWQNHVTKKPLVKRVRREVVASTTAPPMPAQKVHTTQRPIMQQQREQLLALPVLSTTQAPVLPAQPAHTYTGYHPASPTTTQTQLSINNIQYQNALLSLLASRISAESPESHSSESYELLHPAWGLNDLQNTNNNWANLRPPHKRIGNRSIWRNQQNVNTFENLLH